MLVRTVLLLIAVCVNGLPTKEPDASEAFRKSRQLDLGLQEIIIKADSQSLGNLDSRQNQTIESLVKSYFSPVLPTSSDTVALTQTQKPTEFDFSSPTDNENLLCKLPFDFILCKRKKNDSHKEINALIEDDIKKPSTDLVPPFNDINFDASSSTLSSKNFNIKNVTPSDKYSTFNVFNYNSIVTTTKKPFAKKYNPSETVKPLTKSSKSLKEKDVLNTAEPSLESRSYLPPQPEFASAAQTAVEVIRPKEEEEHHHHHHHHHHDENFDICSDAFHSFLCAPLKPRKIITGAFPENLRGQNSFLKYQKLLPSREEVPAPSNTFQNEYLPPEKPKKFDFGASFNSVKTTALPSRTTPKTTIYTTTSSVKTFASPKVVLAPKAVHVKEYVSLSPVSSVPANKPLKPSSTTPNSFLFYTPTVPTRNPIVKTSTTLNEFNSVFIPTVSTVKPTFISSTQVPINPFPEKFISSSSISTPFQSTTEKPLLPLLVPFNSQPTNEDRFYLPPLPAATFISTAKPVALVTESPKIPFVSTKISSPLPTQSTFPSSQLIQSLPQSTIRSSSIIPFSTTTKAPFLNHKIVSTTLKPINVAAPAFVPLTSKLDNSYLPPLPKFQPAANSISTTTKPFSTTLKKVVIPTKLVERPSNVDRSYLPPDPNVQPAAAQVDSVAVSPQVRNPFHHGRDLCTDPFHSFLCSAPKPRKRITGSIPSRFKADSSNTNELKLRPSQSSQQPSLIKLASLDSFATQRTTLNPPTKQSYTKFIASSTTEPKPEKIFSAPAKQKVFAAKPINVKPTTTKKPEILKPSETKNAVGYDYPKPVVAFPLPSQQQLQISSTTSGYSYPKPQKPFPLPTELKEVIKSTPPPPVLKPSSTNQAKGYQYPKPEQTFELPQKQGYTYPKPQKQLVLPTEKPTKAFSTVDLLGNFGSAEFIPVNKLEKRSRLSQFPRFGERLRRQERRISVEESQRETKKL